jgi:hypothetical protein
LDADFDAPQLAKTRTAKAEIKIDLKLFIDYFLRIRKF